MDALIAIIDGPNIRLETENPDEDAFVAMMGARLSVERMRIQHGDRAIETALVIRGSR